LENKCWKKKKGLPKSGPSGEAVNACHEISLTCTEITLGVAMTSKELQTLVREETLVDTAVALLWSQLTLLMTSPLQKRALAATKFLI